MPAVGDAAAGGVPTPSTRPARTGAGAEEHLSSRSARTRRAGPWTRWRSHTRPTECCCIQRKCSRIPSTHGILPLARHVWLVTPITCVRTGMVQRSLDQNSHGIHFFFATKSHVMITLFGCKNSFFCHGGKM
jgi:hypothetical protein